MKNKKGLIVFFVPTQKLVNGGILSIFSICKVSRQFENIHHSRVVLATYPGQKSYKHNDLFENDETIYSFDEVVNLGVPHSLMLHVPEYVSLEVFESLKNYSEYIDKVPDLKVNIMNQNILLMQKPDEVANWFSLTANVTQTTAHSRYASQEIADKYCLPTQHLSTFVDPSQYAWTQFENKQNIVVLSPDQVKERPLIVKKLETVFPTYRIITIHDMKYKDYKDLITKARFIITFGEGFDGYYVESFFSGSMAIAVYNDDFFPDKEFSTFDNNYSSYENMLTNIVKDIKRFNDKGAYEKIVNDNFKRIAALYSYEKYTKNIKNFYLNDFSFVPGKDSAKRLIASVVNARNKTINHLMQDKADMEKLLLEKEVAIQSVGKIVADRDQIINAIANSKSWRLTKPLRKVSLAMRKIRT